MRAARNPIFRAVIPDFPPVIPAKAGIRKAATARICQNRDSRDYGIFRILACARGGFSFAPR